MAHRVRELLAGARTAPRATRGPADGLLAEIQADLLARHPEWAQAIEAIEAKPIRAHAPTEVDLLNFRTRRPYRRRP